MSTQEAELIAREVDLATKVESLSGEVDTACNEARGMGIQAGFRIFRRIALQLQPDFDIKALEVLVTPEVVG